MNDYSYKNLRGGVQQQFSVTVTEQMMDDFKNITGDINPLHNDDSLARQRHYPQRVVYGMLTASFLSTLAGVYLPGRYGVLHSVETKFTHPVFVGDRLLVSGIVTEMNDCARRVVLKVTITNQDGKKVLRGILKAGVLEE